jgi:CheY-like chemotaxis protein
MGAVWTAFDPDLRRRVAVKVLRQGEAPSTRLVERFHREALSIAQLHHPNVLQIHEFGVDNGFPFIVMELLSGEDLRARLQRQTRMSVGAVANIVSQAARALAAAHAAGIVHRDLKPANLFLARADGQETLKILDFGVATILEGDATERRTSPGKRAGTPQYMSPEQALGSPLDHRSDLWSLAVVVYVALTGRSPFEAPTVQLVVDRILSAPVESPRHLVPSLPEEVDAFFARAFARNPSERFQSATELAAAFAAIDEAARGWCSRILVVDDENDVEVLVKQLFRKQIRAGTYDFIFARNGDEGLRQLGEQPDVDVILSDINMPGMDGLTFLGHIGEVNPVAKTVIVSAYGDMANIRTAMNRGAFDFLIKPIEFKDLSATLHKTVQQVRGVRQTLRALGENTTLRLLVGAGVAERLLRHAPASIATHAEREEAAVAFIDVHGFSPVVGAEDPGAAVRLLNDYLEIIVPELTVREGTPLRFDGGTVMATFRGADHLERAVDACLAARARLRPHVATPTGKASYELAMAAGIDAGPLTFGGLGSERIGRVEWTALGEIVAGAARLRSLATTDQILVRDAVRKKIEGRFRCERVSGLPEGAADIEGAVFNVVGPNASDEHRAESAARTMTGDSTELPIPGSWSARGER